MPPVGKTSHFDAIRPESSAGETSIDKIDLCVVNSGMAPMKNGDMGCFEHLADFSMQQNLQCEAISLTGHNFHQS